MNGGDDFTVTPLNRRTQAESRVATHAKGNLAIQWQDDSNGFLRFVRANSRGIKSRNSDFLECTDQMLPTLQTALNARLTSQGFMAFVSLTEGNWHRGNFIGKALQCPRYQAGAKFSCNRCKARWYSSHCTIELIIQKMNTPAQTTG